MGRKTGLLHMKESVIPKGFRPKGFRASMGEVHVKDEIPGRKSPPLSALLVLA